MSLLDRSAAINLPRIEERETPIRLVLVEDHVVLRDGLKALLELQSDVVSVGEFGCIQSSVEGILRLQPDVVVTDLALGGESGIELIREIQRVSPRSRKLVLTINDGKEYIRAALIAGADGYVLKDANSGELLHAIRAVLKGERFLCSGTARRVLASYLAGGAAQAPPSPANPITDREREVLTGIAQGHSNKVIARGLGVSFKTVEKHRSNLMRKLQLHNAAAITMYAIRNGLAGDDAPVLAASGLPLGAARVLDAPNNARRRPRSVSEMRGPDSSA